MLPREEQQESTQDSQVESKPKKDETDSGTSEAVPKKRKYRFECQKTSQCCKSSLLPVQVTLRDLRIWTEKGAITAIFPNLSLKMEEKQPSRLILQKYNDKDEAIDGCPMLDEENNLCKIYHSMPGWCDAFPLLFDGAHFRIMDKTCPGLGKGEISKERLAQVRETSRRAFEARVDTNLILPILSAVWSSNLMRAQAEALKNLSPEDRKNLEEIFRKDQETPN